MKTVQSISSSEQLNDEPQSNWALYLFKHISGFAINGNVGSNIVE